MTVFLTVTSPDTVAAESARGERNARMRVIIRIVKNVKI